MKNLPPLLKKGFPIFCGVGVLFGLLWSRLPIQDSPTYFHFSDTRPFLGIPNSGDVTSNLPFALAGLFGFFKVLNWKKRAPQDPLIFHALIFVIGVILVAPGSAYFHWNPTPDTLVWDRLPMGVSFISLLFLVLSDRIDAHLSRPLSLLLMMLALWSVWNTRYGGADLRPYIAVQFGTILVLLITIVFFRKGRISQLSIAAMISFYLLAKALETFDREVLSALGFVSGHSLKHLSAALATLVFIRGLPTGNMTKTNIDLVQIKN